MTFRHGQGIEALRTVVALRLLVWITSTQSFEHALPADLTCEENFQGIEERFGDSIGDMKNKGMHDTSWLKQTAAVSLKHAIVFPKPIKHLKRAIRDVQWYSSCTSCTCVTARESRGCVADSAFASVLPLRDLEISLPPISWPWTP